MLESVSIIQTLSSATYYIQMAGSNGVFGVSLNSASGSPTAVFTECDQGHTGTEVSDANVVTATGLQTMSPKIVEHRAITPLASSSATTLKAKYAFDLGEYPSRYIKMVVTTACTIDIARK